jgi:hypothetical protein
MQCKEEDEVVKVCFWHQCGGQIPYKLASTANPMMISVVEYGIALTKSLLHNDVKAEALSDRLQLGVNCNLLKTVDTEQNRMVSRWYTISTNAVFESCTLYEEALVYALTFSARSGRSLCIDVVLARVL